MRDRNGNEMPEDLAKAIARMGAAVDPWVQNDRDPEAVELFWAWEQLRRALAIY